MVAIPPFSPAALPGQAPAEGKYMFYGDVTTNRVFPGLVRVTNQSFHQTAAVPVLVRGDVGAAWMALLAGDNLLGVPDAAAATHNIITRRATPIPPPVCKEHYRSLCERRIDLALRTWLCQYWQMQT